MKGKRQHWGQRLDKFRVNHELSVRDLVEVVGGALKKSAIHDLLSGENNPRMDSVIKPVIAGHLRGFLRRKKTSALEIEQQILEIFHEPICTKEIEKVITQRTVLPAAQQRHFGLNRDPFTGDPRNRKELFTTPQLDRIAGQLEDAVNYQGMVALIGDVGAGKSLQKRRLNQTCTDSAGTMQILWPEFMNMEKVHSGSIASFILRKFGQKSPHDLVYRSDRLKELLAGLSEKGTRIALGFDECHRLDPRLLTALKNFYELGSGGYDRYLGLVLFGQPALEMTLRLESFREIAERLDIIHMPNLGRNAWDYITHRIKLAGGTAEKLFDRAAVTKLAEITATPLGLGNLANAALLKAYEFDSKKVLASMVTDSNGDPKVRAIGGARK